MCQGVLNQRQDRRRFRKVAAMAWAMALGAACIVGMNQEAGASDWPMWRYDTSRSAVTSHALEKDLQLHWVRELAPPQRAWPWQMDDFEKLNFDASYQPVAANGLLYVASMVTDSITAYTLDTGEQVWRHVTNGPVRMAPIVAEGRLYAGSDDGHLYCLDAESGELLWKFQAGPSHRAVLGNERLISMWPVRGGAVIADGTLYFAAGLWPHEGVYIHALDAATGEIQWVNSGAANELHVDSKRYYSFGGVAPQGQLVVAGDRLLVPGGRTTPGVFDRNTGELLYYRLASTGKAAGGHEVFTSGDWYFNSRDYRTTHMYDVVDGAQFGQVNIGLVSSNAFLGLDVDSGKISAYARELQQTQEPPRVEYDRLGRPIPESRRGGRPDGVEGRLRAGALGEYFSLEELWASEEIEGLERLHLKAGDTVYGSGPDGRVFAVDTSASPASLAWSKSVDGEVFSMLAAGDRLFVVNKEGAIHCFGPGARDTVVHERESAEDAGRADAWSQRAASLLEETGATEGYGLMFGVGSGGLLHEVLAQSDLHITAYDPDPEKVAELRERLLGAGLYGSRAVVHQGTPDSLKLPPYIASLILSEDPAAIGSDAAALRGAYHSLRPYGGAAYFALDAADQEAFAAAVQSAELEKVEVKQSADNVLLTRPGALPGSAPWTHQYASAGNTGYTPDKRVKAPLGVSWFGGTSNEKTLPRHMHGPIPQIIEGRLIILGVNHISARCVYSGRELWATELPLVGQFFTDLDFEAMPAPVYFPNNPGANFIGSPYASAADSIYLMHEDRCLRIDTATGEILDAFELPDWEDLQQHVRDPFLAEMAKSYGAQVQEGEEMRWGHLKYWGDYLIAAAYPHIFDENIPGRENNWNATSSEFVVGMDRHTGEILWVHQARYGFRHNAIVAGGDQVYVIDNLSQEIRDLLARRGITPELEPQVRALDIRTGEVTWVYDEEVFGTALGYSEPQDILVQSGHPGRRRPLPDEPRDRLVVLQGQTGEKLWAEDLDQRRSPVGLHATRGQILGSADEWAVDMLTGERQVRRHPITGESEDWTWTAAQRCGTQNYSEYLIAFRSGAAGIADLAHDAGTANIPGFRSGCTNNLVVGDGMFNAPEYTRSCSCSYQHQTSLGLVHMPNVEMWTFHPLSNPEPGTIRRAGINFGAPGSRLDTGNEVLWVEFPPVGGPAPDIPVKLTGNGGEAWFRHHTSALEDENGSHRWVAVSGVEGAGKVEIGGLYNGGDGLYTVRLHFAEPNRLAPGERVFDVLLQGEPVLEGFDVAAEAEGQNRAIVKEFEVPANGDTLEVELRSADGSTHAPILSGIEFTHNGSQLTAAR